MTLRITHFMRDSRPNTFSIERLHEDLRNALPQDCEVTTWVCRNSSKGLLPRLRDAWAARLAQGDVNHVTGDTHYLTYFLDHRRTVLTVHDLVSVERSKGLKRFVLWLLWFWLPVKRSRLVITVSENTRQALLKAVRCSPKKVVVINNPVSKEFKYKPRGFYEDYPRILQIGTKPNKNILRVAEALAGLRCKLVVIGPLNFEAEAALRIYGIDYENYIGLSREALLDHYFRSDLLIFASTYEGFGLPIIEANAVGRPVLTSNILPMNDVAQDAACLVDPYDVRSIRSGVARITSDAQYREHLIAAGLRNAERFQVSKIAMHYAFIYRNIAKQKSEFV